MIIELDESGYYSERDVCEKILREYEKANISTGRACELIDKLYYGRQKRWNLDAIWENLK